MLTLHQGLGIGLAAGLVGTMITGQLNYNDKFWGGGNSGRYETLHEVFAFSTLSIAAVVAPLALFAPEPLEKEHGFDRLTLHKIGEFTAFACWAAELVMGLLTVDHEGLFDQRTLAQVHLAIGYTSLAGMLVGVGAIVF